MLDINLKFTSLVKQQLPRLRLQSLVTMNRNITPIKNFIFFFSAEKLCCAGIFIGSHRGGLAAVLNLCRVRLKSH